MKPHIYKSMYTRLWFCAVKNEQGYLTGFCGMGHSAEDAYKDYIRGTQ